jgi:hypothetical protein
MTAFDTSPTTTSPSSFGIACLATALTTLTRKFRASLFRAQPARLDARLARDAGEALADEPMAGGAPDALASHGLSAAQVMDSIARDCRRGER